MNAEIEERWFLCGPCQESEHWVQLSYARKAEKRWRYN
jgi:hypothetical protein